MKTLIINFILQLLFKNSKVSFEDRNLVKMLRAQRFFPKATQVRFDRYVFYFKKWLMNFSFTYDINEKNTVFHFFNKKIYFVLSEQNRMKFKNIISHKKELCLNNKTKKEYTVKSVTEIIKKLG